MKNFEGFHGLAGTEVDLFQKHLAKIDGRGVEIGCCDGFSSVIILESSNLFLTIFDPMVPDSMAINLVGSEVRLLENLSELKGRFKFHNMKASEGLSLVSEPLDFLFIDGDHKYDSVRSDFNQWTPKIRKGGLLAMHDARMSRAGGATFHEGPSTVAVESVFQNLSKWEVVGEAFSLLIARKLK